MRGLGTSQSAGDGRGSELMAALGVVVGASMLVGIGVALLGMLLAFATARADAQTIAHTAAQTAAPSVALPLLPSSVAFDAAGNLYFSDTNRQVVYESSLAGALSVVAGTGVQGFSGDGGPATGAELNSPQGVAVGADGTLYIADTENQRIRAVSGGVISTFAGTGATGFAGDGGAAASALLRGPTALALDAGGALLVCDTGNQRVRRISAGTIQTIAGNGTQGFAGDGGQAAQAELDTPMGIAVRADGSIFVADTHNARIRIIAANETISTFAGTGVAGYAGDGGPATSAELAAPRGVVITSAGTVLFADSNNQRIRMVDANGIITTIAGSGVQGATTDGATSTIVAMNSPRGVTVSGFGAPVYADALSSLVRESVANGSVYVPAGLAPTRTSAVKLSVGSSSGQTTATATVTGAAGNPQGVVELLDGSTLLTQATLAEGTATFPPQTLSAGTHVLSAAYLGDGVNPAASSASSNVSIGTAVVTATANSVSVSYGQAIPMLTGSLSGVQPGDTSNVWPVFTTTATLMSTVGSYPIAATLSGPASSKYTLVMSASSGSLQIVAAATLTAEQPLTQGSYTGLPLFLNADVSSTTQGTPTGTVTFLDNGTVVTSAPLVNGLAAGVYLSPGLGSHAIVASYSGDTNFQASQSQAQTTAVGAMPDFTMTSSGSTTQTVAAGGVAAYTMTVGAQSGAFTGVVDMSASGLPAGATATFSPPQVVPGTSSTTVTMSVQTSAAVTATAQAAWASGALACMVCPLMMWGWRRRKVWIAARLCAAMVTTAAILALSGCAARTISESTLGGQSYTVTVTGTSTNLAGAIVSHSMQVTLIVE
ncbi:MAG: Ig-like domain repeat protein [Acidobacteriaceae bacterium]